MIQASFKKYILKFKTPARTSRNSLITKPTYFIYLKKNDECIATGECSFIKGLSVDTLDNYQDKLNEVCNYVNNFQDLEFENEINLDNFPSIKFGLEILKRDFENGGKKLIFSNDFYHKNKPIPINGLVWMGNKKYMQTQIKQKLEQGFECIKLKIGALDFKSEIELLKSIRREFSADKIELRVDANGAFSTKQVMEKLKILSQLDIHSIEQPIKQGNIEKMALLCEKTPIPIALDEELIKNNKIKAEIIEQIKPQYIIIKPSILGGFTESEEWIKEAEKNNTKWWVTSALESNIGLNAIAQWTYKFNNTMYQGLGTGKLYQNNIKIPLNIRKGKLFFDKYSNNI